MLDALRTDPSLVQEFEATVAIRDSVVADLQSIRLPDDLFTSIENDAIAAGFLTPSATSATTSVIMGSSSALPWIISSLTFVALVTMAMFFAVNVGSDKPITSGESTAAATEAVSDGASVSGSDAGSVSDGASGSESASETLSESESELPVGNDNVIPATVNNGSGRDGTRNDITTASSPAPLPQRIATAVQNADKKDGRDPDAQRLVTNDDVAERSLAPVEPPVLISSADLLSSEPERLEHQTDAVTEQGLIPWEPQDNQQRSMAPITLRVLQRPLTSFSYDVTSDASALGSISLELEMSMGSGHNLGAGFHRDLFPVIVVGSDGSQNMEPFMSWYGAHYRWSPQTSWPLGIRPFLHMGVGGSTRGFVAQPAAGFILPLSSFQIGVGGDAVGLAFQDQGNWSTAVSPALRIELGYSW